MAIADVNIPQENGFWEISENLLQRWEMKTAVYLLLSEMMK
jgi:hypothetical protein